ncbi:diguanylate cyclase [[Leptolyngbya] sp. PCC 7376]|uniref:diguanylate cyclase n=1 Tax=[Leptolyngbya] sp. PCC 7376 TaxID=111781 RepID=UPI00029EDABA|nr:diguanylate cyclase [[Leptolyngbya] sp. PCC 7376]AFY40260.1 diguanylate cyclase [[Leptolyngbya] sp. PCC 7376]
MPQLAKNKGKPQARRGFTPLTKFLDMVKGVDSPSKLLVNVGAAILFLLSMMVMVGWFARYPRLIQISPAYVPMQFNTALGFCLISLSLWALNYQKQAIAKVCGSSTLLLGFLTLTQYIFQMDFGIDEFFIDHYIDVATSHPGRMAPNTALNFCLSGLSILLILRRKLTLNFVFFASTFGASVMGLGFVALLGYLSGVKTAYGWAQLTHMALHTSIGFILVGLLLVVVILHISLRRLRQLPLLFLPMVAGVSGIVVTVALWQALVAAELQLSKSYGIPDQNIIAELILIFGIALALLLAIAMWFLGKFRQKITHLQQAQHRILQLNNQLKKLSYIDSLTSIPNRRMFDLTLEKEWGRALRKQTPLALVFIDIDHFKAYNDFYGHLQGDICLQRISKVIAVAARRTTDMAARYGGEEFVLLLPDSTESYAQAIANDLVEAIENLKLPHSKSPTASVVTISAGVGITIPTQTGNYEQLIDNADQALYSAKAAGRNQAIFKD